MTTRARLIADILTLRAMHADLDQATITLDGPALDGLLRDLQFAESYASDRTYKGATRVQGKLKR